MTVEFGIPIPQVFLDGRADMELVRNSLTRAEELGFHSAWTQDQVTGEASLLDCMSLMTYAAACTSRMRLGVSVIVFPIRNPVQLAKSISSLDHMSGGRVTLGIGLGPPANAANFYRAFGVQYAERVRRFNEGLAVMKGLWTEAEVHLGGEFWHLDGTTMEPKPLQKPHPPVIFGGQHPNALKRAATCADGYMGAGPTPTRSFISHVGKLREYLEEAGRDPGSFPVSKRVYLHVDDDADAAKAVLDDFFNKRYPWMIKNNPDFVADICVWGSAQQCVDGLAEVIAGGAGLIVLNPIHDFVTQIERLADEVVPLLG
jgi:probable F420-dependent oxidoreductase